MLWKEERKPLSPQEQRKLRDVIREYLHWGHGDVDYIVLLESIVKDGEFGEEQVVEEIKKLRAEGKVEMKGGRLFLKGPI